MPASTPTRWGAEFLVNTTTSGNQGQPTVTALADGRFVMVWTDTGATGGDTSEAAVRAQIFHADGTRSGAEFLVSTTTSPSQNAPTITALPDGRFVVAWIYFSDTDKDVSVSEVRAQVFSADGTRSGDEFLVNTTTINFQHQPTITALADGRFVVAWTDASAMVGDTSHDAVRAQVFSADGTRSGDEFLVNTTTINLQHQPTITALADGRFVVAWTDASATVGDTSGDAVRAQVFSADGTRSGDELLVNSRTSSGQRESTITALADGRFVVAWTDYSAVSGDTSSAAVRARVFNADGTRSSNEFLVNTTTHHGQWEPTITALPDGRFAVAWTDGSSAVGDTSGAAVRAQVFNANGTRSGGEFLVNTTTRGDQSQPIITVLADGRLLVAWKDNSATGEDTSGSAVRGQILDPRLAAVTLTGTHGNDAFVGTIFGDRMAGSFGNDRLWGGAGNDKLHGNAGDDRLLGGSGNDSLNGRLGADRLEGGKGNDVYIVDSINDVVVEASGAGTDEVRTSLSHRLAMDLENLLLTGTSAVNGTGNGHANRITGNSASNVLTGGGGSDKLHGKDGDDRLIGGSGKDTLNGGLGADRLEGGWGNDVYIVDSINDVVVEVSGAGTDAVRAAYSYKLGVNLENLLLTGSSALNGTGNGLTNQLTGNGAANVLRGEGSSDRLQGQGGNDRLIGGAGKDTLTGGMGNDAFQFNSRSEGGDIITDFRNVSGNNDVFRIDASNFGGGLAAGRWLAASQFQDRNDNKAQDSNDRFIFEKDASKLWYDSNGKASGGLVLVADLQDGATMTAADIWLF